VNTLSTLSQRDVLAVRMAAGAVAPFIDTDIVPGPSGARTVALRPGLNAFGMTSVASISAADLFGGALEGVETVLRYEPATQEWLVWIPGAPASVNTLTRLDRLDVVFVRATRSFELTLDESAAN
jgi:hypothetical protein